jgi:hypothetical protein
MVGSRNFQGSIALIFVTERDSANTVNNRFFSASGAESIAHLRVESSRQWRFLPPKPGAGLDKKRRFPPFPVLAF